jgi:1-aminocyclopropane-1-carboxylate deaminase/D-cysteine desulfhydrase-like pyridoxal-dependent ACC family enzyme
VLREALDAGADTLVSGGTVQSNSQRQVANGARRDIRRTGIV